MIEDSSRVFSVLVMGLKGLTRICGPCDNNSTGQTQHIIPGLFLGLLNPAGSPHIMFTLCLQVQLEVLLKYFKFLEDVVSYPLTGVTTYIIRSLIIEYYALAFFIN